VKSLSVIDALPGFVLVGRLWEDAFPEPDEAVAWSEAIKVDTPVIESQARPAHFVDERDFLDLSNLVGRTVVSGLRRAKRKAPASIIGYVPLSMVPRFARVAGDPDVGQLLPHTVLRQELDGLILWFRLRHIYFSSISYFLTLHRN